MATLSNILPRLFYFASLLAFAFFVHKVLWLVRYKRLQRALVDEAIRSLREDHEKAIAAWDAEAKAAWASALGEAEIQGGSLFLQRAMDRLVRLDQDLAARRRSIEDLLGEALGRGRTGKALGKVKVISIRRPAGNGEDRLTVEMDLGFPDVDPPRPPERHLYELHARSRYGWIRRALVFFSGAADVVYSSQHVALISQNVHVPTSILVRRLSLAFLVVAVVVIDLVFGVRRWLTGVMTGLIGDPGPAHGFLMDHLGTLLAFGAWMAVYGSIYLVFYFLIRRRYQRGVRRLRELSDGESAAMRQIHDRQILELYRWGRAYGRSLDSAVDTTLRHVETLVDHYVHRLRRRLAGPALEASAKGIADALFQRLPESRGELVDAATQEKHSFRHYVWPRPEEMGYQVRSAQCRAAWQHLEIAVSNLRRARQSPLMANDLWRSAALYASVFAAIVPVGTRETIREAYARTVRECVADTEKDLADLDRHLGELVLRLRDQLDFARALVQARIEIASQHVQAGAAERSAEIISVREQARLEAMAFEI